MKISKETYDEWHKDAKNWKWGILYFNKKDKRIFPPKKNKFLGWTTNFANPISVFFFVLIILGLTFLLRYIKNL
jgi:uncharacterized membrane protein